MILLQEGNVSARSKDPHTAWKPRGLCLGAAATRKAQLWRGVQRAEQVLGVLAGLGSSWELGLVLPCLCRHVEPAWELLPQLSRV